MAEYNTNSHNSYAAYAYPQQGDQHQHNSHFNAPVQQQHPAPHQHHVHNPYGHRQSSYNRQQAPHHAPHHSKVTNHHAATHHHPAPQQHQPQPQATHDYSSNYHHQPYYHPQGAPPYPHTQPHHATQQQQPHQHRPASVTQVSAQHAVVPPPQPHHPYSNVKHQPQYPASNGVPHSPNTTVAACCNNSTAGGSSGSAGRRGSSCSLTESEWTTGSSSPFTPPRTPSPSAPTATTPMAGSGSYNGHNNNQGSSPLTPTSSVVTAHNPYALTGPIPVDPPSPTLGMPVMNSCAPAYPPHRKGHHYPPAGVHQGPPHNHYQYPQPQQQQQQRAQQQSSGKGMMFANQANLVDSQLSLPPNRKYNQRNFGAPQPHNNTPSLSSAIAALAAPRPSAPAQAATISPPTTPAVAPASTNQSSSPSSAHTSSFVACPQSTAFASSTPNDGGVEERKDLRRYESLARDPNVRSRFDFLYAMLAGRLVELQLKDGTRYQGIFHSKVPREFSLKLMQVRLVTCSVYGPRSHSRPRTSLRVNDCDIAYLHAMEVPHDEEGYEELL